MYAGHICAALARKSGSNRVPTRGRPAGRTSLVLIAFPACAGRATTRGQKRGQKRDQSGRSGGVGGLALLLQANVELYAEGSCE